MNVSEQTRKRAGFVILQFVVIVVGRILQNTNDVAVLTTWNFYAISIDMIFMAFGTLTAIMVLSRSASDRKRIAVGNAIAVLMLMLAIVMCFKLAVPQLAVKHMISGEILIGVLTVVVPDIIGFAMLVMSVWVGDQ